MIWFCFYFAWSTTNANKCILLYRNKISTFWLWVFNLINKMLGIYYIILWRKKPNNKHIITIENKRSPSQSRSICVRTLYNKTIFIYNSVFINYTLILNYVYQCFIIKYSKNFSTIVVQDIIMLKAWWSAWQRQIRNNKYIINTKPNICNIHHNKSYLYNNKIWKTHSKYFLISTPPPTHKKASTRKSLHAKPDCYTELAKL